MELPLKLSFTQASGSAPAANFFVQIRRLGFVLAR